MRSGYAVIVGRPNVGKSTLMNQLLQVKLSIVSPKPQTTRQRVLGILNEPQLQVVFLDTPGMLQPHYELHAAMMRILDRAVESADVLLFMTDASDPGEPDFVRSWTGSPMARTELPKILLLNKVDLVPKLQLLPLIDGYQALNLFQEIIPVSALHNDGMDRVRTALTRCLPEQPPFYPVDALTEQPERFFVGEIIREKVFYRYADEVPYAADVHVEEFKERDGAKDFIRAVIYVERPSQKAILIGKRGSALKQVGEVARREIEAFLDRPVYLELWVKVKERWREDRNTLHELGYL